MGLTVVHGDLGSGKTLFLTIIAFLSKRKIVSNYHLTFDYEPFDLQKFLNAEYDDCLLLLDEAYVFLESRDSSLSRNKLSSYVLFQSRKKSVDLYLSVQLKSTIDIRYREMTNRHVICQGTYDGIGKKRKPVKFDYIILDKNTGKSKSLTLPVEKAKQYFKLYDTNEVIKGRTEVGEFLTIDQQIALSKELANKVFEKVGVKSCNKSWVKTYLAENHQPSAIQDYVYTYIKELQGK